MCKLRVNVYMIVTMFVSHIIATHNLHIMQIVGGCVSEMTTQFLLCWSEHNHMHTIHPVCVIRSTCIFHLCHIAGELHVHTMVYDVYCHMFLVMSHVNMVSIISHNEDSDKNICYLRWNLACILTQLQKRCTMP